ncbi:MAG: hypothetical protein WC223_05115 [Bacteroidales bacterium]|jgi:hypothetical protein
MISWKKILFGVGIGGGIFAVANYFSRLKKTSAQLQTNTTVNLQKIDLKGITLRVDSVLKNPTNTGLKIKFPFVKLLYKDVVIGSSQVIDKDIEIPAFGEAHIDKIMLEIPLMGIFSLGTQLLQAFQGSEPVKLQVQTITTIDLGIKKIPFEKTDDIYLKKQSDGK